jgi:DHA1 family inner membrane transport protein
MVFSLAESKKGVSLSPWYAKEESLLNTSRDMLQQRANKTNPRIALLALGMFALGTDAFVIAGVLPQIATATHVQEALAGQLVTVFSLTYGLGAPMLAALVGRWSPSRVLICALGAFCLANLGSALAPTFPLLFVTRLFAGGSAALYGPLAFTIGTQLAPPERRGQALALVVLGFTVATVFGSPLGTWVGEQFGWRLSFGLIVGLAGVAFVALLICGLPKAAAPATVSLRARLAPIIKPSLVLALLPGLLWNLGIYTIYTYIASLLEQTLQITQISGPLIVFGAGVVIGNWSGGMLSDRFRPTRLLLLSLSALVEVLLSLAMTTLMGSILLLGAWGCIAALSFVPQQHRLLGLAPAHTNVLLALNNSTVYLGEALGAVLGGIVLRVASVTLLGWAGASCTFLALLLLLLSRWVSSRSLRFENTPHPQQNKGAPIQVQTDESPS